MSGRNVAALRRGSAAAAETGRGAAAETDGGVAAESDAAAGRGGGGTESTTSSESPLTFGLMHPHTHQLRVWEGLVERGWWVGGGCVVGWWRVPCVLTVSDLCVSVIGGPRVRVQGGRRKVR